MFRDMGEKWSAEGVPRRDLSDPRVLRALAHPVRWQIIDQLVVHGPATATELADRLDASPSNLSWHLRQLAKHGFIEEADGGSGRQRPWRFVPQSSGFRWSEDDDPELARAKDMFIQALREQDLRGLRAWQEYRHREPPEWRDAAAIGSSNYIWLTAAELAAFNSELTEVVERHLMPHVGRLDAARRPAGSRPIQFNVWAVPTGPPHPVPAPEQSRPESTEPDPPATAGAGPTGEE